MNTGLQEWQKAVANGKPIIALSYSVPNKFKIIKITKEIGFQTLIGNAGGYIGLLLGKLPFEM